jgi:hypothetical protein
VRLVPSTHTRGLVPPVPWPVFLRGGSGVETLVDGQLWVLRLLVGLPAESKLACPACGHGPELGLANWPARGRGGIQAAGSGTPAAGAGKTRRSSTVVPA